MKLTKKQWRGIENLFLIMFFIIFWLAIIAIALYNQAVFQNELINELIIDNGKF